MRTRLLVAVGLAACGSLTVASGAASARPSEHRAAESASVEVCTGGDIATGTYASINVTGLCYVANGADVTVTGNLTVAPGAMLDAISPGGTGVLGTALPGNIAVDGDVSVSQDAVLLLGWCLEPNGGVGYHNCDDQLSGSTDSIGGSLSATDAISVIVHGVDISGSVIVKGGGGGRSCTEPTLFSEDTDPAVNGTVSVGYDFSPVNYSDLESSTIGHKVVVKNLRSCWFGALRDAVKGNFTYSKNKMADSDANEVVDNTVTGNMACTGNVPAVQFGDSGEPANVVDGKATGQCAAPISVKG